MKTLFAFPLLVSVLEANGECSVRVRARTRPHDAWFFRPWGGTALGQATFTFVQ
jgi:hypothetical protein